MANADKQESYMKYKSMTGFTVLLFLFIGFIFSSIGIWAAIDNAKFMKNAVEVHATIISFSRSGSDDSEYPVVEFAVDGKTYSGSLNHYNSRMRVGQQQKVYYNPLDPNEFRSNDVIIAVIFATVGVGMLVASIAVVVNALRRRALRRHLMTCGKRIEAIVVDVGLANIRINGQCGQYVLCEHRDEREGKTYRFKSRNFWTNLRFAFPDLEGKIVDVYVLKDNYAKYHVELSGLFNDDGSVIDLTGKRST